jgi:GAF domain-containing protein
MSAIPTVVAFPNPTSQLDETSVPSVPLSDLVAANRQRDALYKLSEQIAQAEDLEAIYSAALIAIESVLDCDRSSILLLDASGTMSFVASHGLSDAYCAAVTGHSPWKPDVLDPTPIAIPDVAHAKLDGTLRDTILDEGIHAVAFIPLTVGATLIGKFMAYFRAPYSLSRDDISGALTIARQLGFAIQRQRTSAALAADLEAAHCLQQLSVDMAHAADLGSLYQKIVDAAALIMGSDFASMQEFHAESGERGELKLLAGRGFSAEAMKLWAWVRPDSACGCGRAFKSGKREVVADILNAPFMAGTKDLEGYRAAGMAAMQSTPLLSRSGQLVGMISTHWRKTHQPSDRDLRLFDILARLAADLIERKVRDEDLRRREERARTLTLLLTDVPWQARADGAFEELQAAWENYTGQTFDVHAGHGWFDAIHADDRDAVRSTWANACFEARPYEYRARIWHAPSNQHRLCLIRATPIRNADGSLREWVGACSDLEPARAAGK